MKLTKSELKCGAVIGGCICSGMGAGILSPFERWAAIVYIIAGIGLLIWGVQWKKQKPRKKNSEVKHGKEKN